MIKLLITCCLFVCISTLASAKIIFDAKREDNFEIYTINDDGSDLERLTYHQRYDHCPRWSPDGKQIVFVRRFDEARQQHGALFLMNVDGSDPRQLSRPPENDGPNVAWSPDGKRLAFRRRIAGKGEIHVLEIATGDIEQLTRTDGLIADPRWSPDGKQIVYRYEGEAGNSIYTMSIHGNFQKPLIPPKGGPILRFSPAWSPDGKTIVFAELEWLERIPESRLIFYNTVSKTHQIRLLPTGVQDVSWMGDDALIISAKDDKSRKYDIYRYDIATESLLNLTNTPNLNEYNPHWIRDSALDVPLEGKTTCWGEIKTRKKE